MSEQNEKEKEIKKRKKFSKDDIPNIYDIPKFKEIFPVPTKVKKKDEGK